MGQELGELLRRWRKERRLSLAELAAQAGVATRTVSGWELGHHQPRLVELSAVLAVLQIPSSERPAALALIDAPRAHRSLSSAASQVVTHLDREDHPVPGHLLRALRQRRGLTLEAVALKIGTSRGVVSRWERSDTTPNAEQLLRLLEFLGARPEERHALTTGRHLLRPPTDDKRLSVQAMEQRLLALERTVLHGDRSLMDLEFLAWQVEFWPLMPRFTEAQKLLATGWGSFAEWIRWDGRLREAGTYAKRAIQLWQSQDGRGRAFLEGMACAVNVVSNVTAHGASPKRSAAIVDWLRDWVPTAVGSPWEAGLHREMAQHTWRAGQFETADALSRDACWLAERSGDEERVRSCKGKRAQLLMHLGQPERAIAISPLPKPNDIPFGRLRSALHWAALLQAAGDPSAADRLTDAYALIERYGFSHYRAAADALARQI